MSKLLISLVFFVNCAVFINGHGTVLKPLARQSLWRSDWRLEPEYDDTGLWCGGFLTQWEKNGGKCGLCGDNFADPIPRKHELGGGGSGKIVETYQQGGEIKVSVDITANHFGYFIFDLCNLDEMSESDECFAKYPLNMIWGSDKYYLTTDKVKTYYVDLRLSPNVTCNHCVLRWTYIAGNSWGMCNSEYGAIGCGNQENFRACSDIKILPKPVEVLVELPEEVVDK